MTNSSRSFTLWPTGSPIGHAPPPSSGPSSTSTGSTTPPNSSTCSPRPSRGRWTERTGHGHHTGPAAALGVAEQPRTHHRPRRFRRDIGAPDQTDRSCRCLHDRCRRRGLGLRIARHRPGHGDRDGRPRRDDRRRLGRHSVDRRRRHRLRRTDERGAHRAVLRCRGRGRDSVGRPGVPQSLRPSAGQASTRCGGIRTDAGSSSGCQIRREPADRRPHRRTGAAGPGRGDRAGQPVRASRSGRHLRGSATGHRRNRAHRNRSERSPADQPGAGRHDAAGIGIATPRARLRHRHSSEQCADPGDVGHAAKPLRTQRHRRRSPSAGQARRFLQLGGVGRVAGARHPLRPKGPLMGMTTIEKIFARKAGLDSVSPGDTVVVDVDMTVLIDLQFATMWIQPNRIHDPDKLAVVMDHAVPAPTIKDAAGGPHARKFVADFGIERFYDVGRHGICHQVIAENGLARPGEILACTDSHTCAAGAYNTAARGLGPAEVYSIMCTGTTWFQVAPTIRYELDGAKPNTVSGKDIFLHIANEYGDAANLNLEFGGPGLAGIPMHDRRTIATQGAEVSADFSTFEADDVLMSFLDERGVTGYQTAAPDSDAAYQDVRHIDLSTLEPYVARPGTVSRNGLPVSRIERQKIDQAFIGSCANGQLEDLEIAAKILRGNPVATGGRVLVTPASQAVYREAMRLGYLQDIADAGAVITNSTCGACFGYHMGVVGPGEVCITSSTRNFTGRMGSAEAEIFMASPATVAASAITGYITDPRSVTA